VPKDDHRKHEAAQHSEGPVGIIELRDDYHHLGELKSLRAHAKDMVLVPNSVNPAKPWRAHVYSPITTIIHAHAASSQRTARAQPYKTVALHKAIHLASAIWRHMGFSSARILERVEDHDL
jgi:hypothetical protein